MPAQNAVLTPFTADPATRLSDGLWRKRVLPVGSIDYKGRRLNFTPEYLRQLADTYAMRAYDQVPFQLAPDDNSHTNDVERFGGEIKSMDLDMNGPDGPGLYAILRPTQRGDAVLTSNPSLGVSARIVEDYQRSDGQFYPAAIQHVLGTLDPRITGLGPWHKITGLASDDVMFTLDLSTETFTGNGDGGPGVTTPSLDQAQQQRLMQLLALPQDQWNRVVTAAGLTPGDVSNLNGGGQPPGGAAPQQQPEDEMAAMIEQMSDADLAALEAEFNAEMAGAASASGLSVEGMMALEMANATNAETMAALGEMRGQLDAQRYKNLRNKLMQAGVPPYMTDLAQPLLAGGGQVVELANGQQASTAQIAERLLTEFGRATEMLDLSLETGSAVDEEGQENHGAQAREDLIGRARQQMFGIMR